MGNQQSKAESDGSAGVESLPKFAKSETKESSRSLRMSFRGKLPGSKNDSPRSSTAGFNGDTDKSDAASIKSSKSAKSNGGKSHRGSTSSNRPSMDKNYLEATSPEEPPM